MTVEEVRAVVGSVRDPELPVVTLESLGMIEEIRCHDDSVEVDLLPTFAGCPATEVIGRDVEAAIAETFGLRTQVRFLLSPAWTTDRMNEQARVALPRFGITAPLPASARSLPIAAESAPACPRCGSVDTRMTSAFGPTPCRTLRSCASCDEPFEAFRTHPSP